METRDFLCHPLTVYPLYLQRVLVEQERVSCTIDTRSGFEDLDLGISGTQEADSEPESLLYTSSLMSSGFDQGRYLYHTI